MIKKSTIYKLLTFYNDINAIKKGTAGKRVGRCVAGKSMEKGVTLKSFILVLVGVAIVLGGMIISNVDSYSLEEESAEETKSPSYTVTHPTKSEPVKTPNYTVVHERDVNISDVIVRPLYWIYPEYGEASTSELRSIAKDG